MSLIRSKYFLVALSLVLLDVVTKLLALYFLPFEESVPIIPGAISFFLNFNTQLKSGNADQFLRYQPNKNLLLVLYFASVHGVLLLYLLIIRRVSIKYEYKWLGALVTLILASIIRRFIVDYFQDVQISDWNSSVITKVIGVMLFGYLVKILNNPCIKISFLLLAVCGFANLLNQFYPPYYIIDFIDVEGSSRLNIGVFNIADLIGDIGVVLLLITLVAMASRKLFVSNTTPLGD